MTTARNPSALQSILKIVPAVLLAIPCLWALFYFGVYLGLGNLFVVGHQEFAARSVAQIEPAAQIDQIFADCRHYITYGSNDVPLFNSVAYFGDRYELTMQVPVRIRSSTSGEMSGRPKFHLNEVREIHTENRGATFARNLEFGPDEWKSVFEHQGDFRAIGFAMDPSPVANFKQYADNCRPSN